MRIISGDHKGRNIKVYKNFTDRPTTDFAKEGIFNVINNLYYFDDIKVLDLFAGTGSISFEFASHNTPHITIVDANPDYIDFIAEQTHIFENTAFEFITADVFEFLKNAKLDYDLIFADPPYDIDGIENLPDLVMENEFLPDHATFILEHSKHYNFKNHKFFIREKKYGKVHFSLFSKTK